MNTILQIDVSDVVEKMNEFSRRVSPEKFEKVYRHTFKDTGRKIRTICKETIPKDYCAGKRKIGAAIKNPIIVTSGSLVLMVPVSDARGKIGKKGMFAGNGQPGAAIVRSGNSLLPTTGDRVHFFIKSGRLAGHMFVRHKDGKIWRGERRERQVERYQDTAGRNRKRRVGEVKEYGMRKRIGLISHAVGIGVPQMPMNRSADDVQSQTVQFADQRFKHYARQALNGSF